MPNNRIKKKQSSKIHSLQPTRNSIQRPEHIIIAPTGDINPGIYRSLCQQIHQTFGYQIEIMPLLQNVDFAFNPSRNQYHSTLILEKLAESISWPAIKILAITGVDLFIPILTHVYGEAQLDGKACIVSTYRLKEGFTSANIQKFKDRIVKECIHELGHTFNLRHCPDKTCIMHYCRSVKDVDRKSDQLCRYCNVLLADEIRRLEGK
jgi:archaemetzincin